MLHQPTQELGSTDIRRMGDFRPVARIQYTVQVPSAEVSGGQNDHRYRPIQSLALRQQVLTLLEKRAIEPVDPLSQDSGFYSTYFIIPKKGGGLHPILDLRPLNKHLRVLKFCMLHTTDVLQGIRQDDWFTAIDLKDAYFHVPIAPHHRQFLRFAFEGRAYQFRVLPFGISLAPRVFTRFVAAALFPLQGRGMRIFPYLDDWLVCARSRVDALSNSALLIEHVTRLGHMVNYAKSSLTPSQRAVFIGSQLDSQLRAAPSSPWVDDIVQLLQQFRRGHTQPFRSFQTLLGTLPAASAVVLLGLLTLQPLQIWMNNLGLHPQHHRHKMVRVTVGCLKCLRPWKRRARLIQGVPMGSIPSRREVLTTDASVAGWGAVWQCRAAQGSWAGQQREQH